MPLLATSQLRTFSQCRDLICLISLHLSVSPCFACHKQTCSKDPSHESITNLRSCNTDCWRNCLGSLFLPLAFALPFAFALGLFRTLERKVSNLLTIITFTFLELLLRWFLLRRCWLRVPHRLRTSRLKNKKEWTEPQRAHNTQCPPHHSCFFSSLASVRDSCSQAQPQRKFCTTKLLSFSSARAPLQRHRQAGNCVS